MPRGDSVADRCLPSPGEVVDLLQVAMVTQGANLVGAEEREEEVCEVVVVVECGIQEDMNQYRGREWEWIDSSCHVTKSLGFYMRWYSDASPMLGTLFVLRSLLAGSGGGFQQSGIS